MHFVAALDRVPGVRCVLALFEGVATGAADGYARLTSNRKYAILELELAKVGANPGRTALDLFDLDRPALDWTHLAGAMGVEAARAETLEDLADLLGASNRRNGPFLIELVIP